MQVITQARERGVNLRKEKLVLVASLDGKKGRESMKRCNNPIS